MTTTSRSSTAGQVGRRLGFRSGLEETVAQDLKSRGVQAQYETVKIHYTKPSKPSTYTPDFAIELEERCRDCHGSGCNLQPTGERDQCRECSGTGVFKWTIIIETKGRFVTADRLKHLEIKRQHPDLDIRFVFSNSNQRLSKSSKTTYAAWCKKHGFLYADKRVPDAWLAPGSWLQQK